MGKKHIITIITFIIINHLLIAQDQPLIALIPLRSVGAVTKGEANTVTNLLETGLVKSSMIMRWPAFSSYLSQVLLVIVQRGDIVTITWTGRKISDKNEITKIINILKKGKAIFYHEFPDNGNLVAPAGPRYLNACRPGHQDARFKVIHNEGFFRL